MRPYFRAFVCAGLFSILLTASTLAGLDYRVRLARTEFIPAKITNVAAKSAALQEQHVLIQFDGPLDNSLIEQLANDGIELQQYIPNFTFTARLANNIDQSTIDYYGIRWFDRMEPDYKIGSMLADLGVAEWARRGDGRAEFAIGVHEDIDPDLMADLLQNDFQAEILEVVPELSLIELILPDNAYYRVAEFDEVMWIEQAEPPRKVTNNISRISTGAEYVQAPPYNLTGLGVTVAEWDGGHADQGHPDFSGRVIYGDGASETYHATHVAGTIMGDGTSSGGTYRGMAPSARLLSFLWWSSGAEAFSEYAVAKLSFGARIATNSWGLSAGDPASYAACNAILGNYLSADRYIDNIVRDGPWVICWSAGNDRSTAPSECGSVGFVWNSIGGYACSKNIITVGNINGVNNVMNSSSSWGPCDDGRLKPDVVGPGTGVTSCNVGGGYITLSGTSMSAPAVAGVAALMLEQGEITFPGKVFLGSTIKGILMNTARDLGYTGPDYSYGHGRIDALKAVNKIVDGDSSYVETEISTGEVHIYDLTVPPSDDGLRVTVVWDDPGASIVSGPALINDLDLVLIDPFLDETEPWVLDPDNPSLPATRGIDHTNNVETITISNALPGLWKVRVNGFNVPVSPQKYTIIFHPDGINRPGNTVALAAYDTPDATIDPGLSHEVGFWISNVGGALDSMTINIVDNQGWIDQVILVGDTLDQYDSAYYSVIATVPTDAFAWEIDTVTCTLTSRTDPAVVTSGHVAVKVGALYSMSFSPTSDIGGGSPDTPQLEVSLTNTGNNYDGITLIPSDQAGWTISPFSVLMNLAPDSAATVTFTVSVPAEVADGQTDLITISAAGSESSFDQTDLTLTVANPYFPPSLQSPPDDTYSQNRLVTFGWDSDGDSYSLFLFPDFTMSTPDVVFTGIPTNSFTIPTADSLSDGGYYWAVKKFIGTDSSSLQLDAFRVVVDTEAPGIPTEVSPKDGAFVGTTTTQFLFTGGGSINASTEKAPEFHRIMLSQDSTYATGTTLYDNIGGIDFLLNDPLAQGPWYWKIQKADSAGNESAFSEGTSFSVDTEVPATPTLVSPSDGSLAGGLSLTFRWTTDAPPPYPESPEYYYIQIATDANFYSTIYTQNLIYGLEHVVDGAEFVEEQTYYWRMRAKDETFHSSSYQTPFSFTYIGFVCGDANANGTVNVSDITFLVSYLFGIPPGEAPEPFLAGSVNGDQWVNISDVTYLVEYLFGIPSGSSPICAF